ncbi:hypothetical protein B0H11DRAFT_2222132 [Mycena galericulata]|nr:hypothetical protein B0H11DRAFT_2222132 [Mycena galericulata]
MAALRSVAQSATSRDPPLSVTRTRPVSSLARRSPDPPQPRLRLRLRDIPLGAASSFLLVCDRCFVHKRLALTRPLLKCQQCRCAACAHRSRCVFVARPAVAITRGCLVLRLTSALWRIPSCAATHFVPAHDSALVHRQLAPPLPYSSCDPLLSQHAGTSSSSRSSHIVCGTVRRYYGSYLMCRAVLRSAVVHLNDVVPLLARTVAALVSYSGRKPLLPCWRIVTRLRFEHGTYPHEPHRLSFTRKTALSSKGGIFRFSTRLKEA